MKHILVIESSPREKRNSDLLCDEFIRGAAESGHHVKKVCLREKKIEYCRACYACFKTGKCVLRDDMAEILDDIQNTDTLVLASPVYFRTINGQMKVMIDRLLPEWQDLEGHDVYLIITGHDRKAGLILAEKELRDIWSGLGCSVRKTIWGEGVWQKGEVLGTSAIWWGEEPRIIDTFVESYDLSGKTVVNFCTSGGSGVSASTENLKALSPDANWLEGHRFETDASEDVIQEWLDGLDIPNVSVTK